ncbi:MAG: flagellar biosynthesis anti-sigma factor FlgM [Fibrobacteres bacterium]|nr:flagellar biosynthesis anti-sigma factor FlgM [Fibrobacterota bacterium]
MNISGIQLSGALNLPPEGQKGIKASSAASVSKKDRVELSNSSEKRDPTSAGIAAVAAAGDPVRDERIQEVRKRLEEGFYEQPEVIEATADRLLRKKMI